MARLIVWGLVGLCAACSSGGPQNTSTGASSGASASGSMSGTVGSGQGGGSSLGSGSIASGSSTSGSVASGTGVSGAASTGATSGTGVASGVATGSGAGASGSMTSPTDAGGATGQDATMVGPAVDAGDYPMLVDGGPCPANAIFCDNFEEYGPIGMVVNGMLPLTQMRPNWYQFSFHGFPRVDTVMPLLPGKKHSAFLDTEAGSYRFAAFIHETPDGTPVAPLAHYGRVMANIKAVSPMTQWNIIEVQGLLPNSTTELATFSFGGNKGHLAAGYAQRRRVLAADGGVALRPGVPENDAERTKITQLDCTKTATTQTMTVGKWTCIEWNIDAARGVMHLWIDGVAQTEVDVAGQGTECSIGMPTTPWAAPAMFTKINLVWEGYGTDSPGQLLSYDEFAVGTQRIGCSP
jgi:hypothetical protein